MLEGQKEIGGGFGEENLQSLETLVLFGEFGFLFVFKISGMSGF